MLAIPFVPVMLNDKLLEGMDVRLDAPCIDVMVMFVSQQAHFLMIAVPMIWPYALYRIYRCGVDASGRGS